VRFKGQKCIPTSKGSSAYGTPLCEAWALAINNHFTT
jgi:hypothetical protein